MNRALRDFVDRADVSAWSGLPPVSPADLGIELDDARVARGERGDPPRPGRWISAPTRRYAEGLRCWLDETGAIDLVEGVLPEDDDGGIPPAPELPEPDTRLDATLDALTLDGGEWVFADRGLAVRVNPANGALLALLGFAPTTAEDYRSRLRPAPVRTIPLDDRSRA